MKLEGVNKGAEVCNSLARNELSAPSNYKSEHSQNIVTDDRFPPIVKAIIDPAKLPPLPPELIEGVLRKGAYMALVGASKIGKTMTASHLAVCIQNGLKWLNFNCRKGNVLYLNFEVQGNSYSHRVNKIYQEYAKYAPLEPFDILNLRGYDVGIEELQNRLDMLENYDIFIIDPQFKVNLGDENSAAEQAAFFNHIDHIANKHNTSVVVCHHHSKYSKLGVKAIDRASGSGVMARSVDAYLDMIEVDNCEPPQHLKGARALVLTPIMRDFEDIAPIGLWYKYPRHFIDETGEIMAQYTRKGSSSSNDEREAFLKVFNAILEEKGKVSRKELLSKTSIKDVRTIDKKVSAFCPSFAKFDGGQEGIFYAVKTETKGLQHG